MRIVKLLAHKGYGSRKEVQDLIKQGAVTVNDVVVKKKDAKIDVEADVVKVHGDVVNTQMVYYVKLHKPAGYITAVDDPRHSTVMELVPDYFSSLEVYPVGRLDKNTEGLLLLTNDGTWAHRIIHGKKEVWKTYYVEFEGTLSEEGLERMRDGMVLGDGTELKPARFQLLGPQAGEIQIQEGKYHQVKRMIGAAGGEVTYLKRTAVGEITLEGIDAPGEWTELTEEEMASFS